MSVLKLAAGLIKTEGDSSLSSGCMLDWCGCFTLLHLCSFAHLMVLCEYTHKGFKYRNEEPLVIDSRAAGS